MVATRRGVEARHYSAALEMAAHMGMFEVKGQV
jgi:hypothetical protein